MANCGKANCGKAAAELWRAGVGLQLCSLAPRSHGLARACASTPAVCTHAAGANLTIIMRLRLHPRVPATSAAAALRVWAQDFGLGLGTASFGAWAVRLCIMLTP